VVIPKDMRDALGLEPGDEVSFWLEDDHVVVRRAEAAKPLLGRFAGSGLMTLLEEERRRDAERERRRDAEHQW
jgi:AbrB family looped-hinge helix DNA binding protein